MKSLDKDNFDIKKSASKEVATVIVRHNDHILMGKRNDNDRWTNPGGHIDQGETPLEAAKRELKEEAGLVIPADKIKKLTSKKVTTFTGKEMKIHAFVVDVDKKPKAHSKNDPDEEVSKWEWIDISQGLPEHVKENLHSPKNVALQKLGVLKALNFMWSLMVDDELMKSERPGHKYIRKYEKGSRTVYVYKKDGKEIHRYDNETAVDSLLTMGAHLDSLDEVREVNSMGFNKIDKKRWRQLISGFMGLPKEVQTQHVGLVRNILKKYKRQLSEQFGEEEYEHTGLGDPTIHLVTPVRHPRYKTLQLPLKSDGRMGKNDFAKYVTIHREMGLKGAKADDGGFVWILPRDKEATFDWGTYEKRLNEIGVQLGDIPEPEESTPAAPVDATGLSADATVDEAIEAIKSRRAQKVLAIKRTDDGKFSFYHPYDDRAVAFFKNSGGEISGIMEYNPTEKSRESYEIELVQEAMQKFHERFPDWRIITGGVNEAIRAEEQRHHELRKPIPHVAAKLNPAFKLFPYQNEAVRFLEAANGNALIGDEMGLGKTLQSLAYVAGNNKRVLVVVPKVVRRTWIQEAEKFFPDYFKGKTKELIAADLRKDGMPDLSGVNIATINYESLEKFRPAIEAAGFDTIIVDESHRIKSPKAKVTQLISEMAPRFAHKILLSGTAIKNKKDELHTQIQLIRPGLFSRGELQMGTIGGVWNKLKRTGVYLARQKRKVLTDLPEKTTQITEVPVAGMPDFPADIGGMSAARVKAALAKTKATKEFVEEIIESSDSNVLVFTESVEAAEKLKEELGDIAILHHGSMADDKREAAKAEFQREDSPKRIFISTRQSLAVGATLTRADKVVFNDLPWTAADLRQAEDRAHRVGQRKNVNVYWITAQDNEWDTNVAEIVKRKYELNRKLNEGKQLTKEEREWMEKPVTLEEVRAAITGRTPGPTTEKSFYISDLLKAAKGATVAGHKYIRKYRKGARWIYVYNEGDQKHELTEEKLEIIRKLAELGDENAKSFMQQMKDAEEVASPQEEPQSEPETPRAEAEEEANQNYFNARSSAFSNIGEDVGGAARHRAARTLAEMRSETGDIDADELREANPVNLIDSVESNTINAYLLNQMLNRFPDYKHKVGPGEDQSREGYLAAFEHLKEKVESLKGDTRTFDQIILDVRRSMVAKSNELRASGNPRGFSAVANFVNNILTTRVKRGSIANDFSELAKAAIKSRGLDRNGVVQFLAGPEGKEAVKKLIEGKKLNKVFGIESEGTGQRRFNLADLYVVDRAEREGPELDLQSREKQQKFLVDKCQMRAVQWGNSVTDEERKHHLEKSAEAFKDLADILGLPDKMVSFNGRLALAIGARGRGTALAHYEPEKVVINLTRKSGVGTLAHEWGHFLDNILAKTHERGGMFLSDASRFHSPVGETMEAMRDLTNSQQWRDFKDLTIKSWREFKSKGFMIQKLSYWASTEEMFARAFETYIDHKLKKAGRKNTYLSAGNRGVFWPTDEMIEQMTPLFDKFFEKLRASEHINKAMRYIIKADKIPGGLADKKTPKDFDQKQLKDGIKIEMEHTSNKKVAQEIAMDHLTEDPKYYIKLKQMEKAELFVMDLIKGGAAPGSHKYLRKYMRNGQWVYVYHEGDKHGRQIPEEAVHHIKKLAELGDEHARGLHESLTAHDEEKLKVIRQLADLGDKEAHKHLLTLGIDREKERLEESLIQQKDGVHAKMDDETKQKAHDAIKRAIHEHIHGYLAGHAGSPYATALSGHSTEKHMERLAGHKSVADLLGGLHEEMSKIDQAHRGLPETRNDRARAAGGYGSLAYNEAIKNMERAGVLPEGYSDVHKRTGSEKPEAVKFKQIEEAREAKRRQEEERRRQEEERMRREMGALFETHGESLRDMMDYFNRSGLSTQDQKDLMKGMDKFFGKDFKFKELRESLQGHRDVEIKIGSGFINGLVEHGKGRSDSLEVGFDFLERRTGRRITGASRKITKNSDGSIQWYNGVFNRASDADLERFPGMAKGLYGGVEKFLKKVTANYQGAAKENTRVYISTCANSGFSDGFKGALVWAKHYFDFKDTSEADQFKSNFKSRLGRFAERSGMKPEHVQLLKQHFDQCKYPYEFVKTGFAITKQQALQMTGRSRLDSDFDKIFETKGRCDIGEILLIDSGMSWSGINYVNRTSGRAGHLNEIRTQYYAGQAPREAAPTMVESTGRATSAPAPSPSRPTSTAPPTGESQGARLARYWRPAPGRRNITMTERRLRSISRLSQDEIRDFLRTASLTPDGQRRVREILARR